MRGGQILLLAFALFAFLGTAPAMVALAGLSLLLLAQRDFAARAILSTTVVRLALLFLAFLAFRMLLATIRDPGTAGEHIHVARQWAMLALCIPVGYWISRVPRGRGLVMLLALTGLTLSAATEIDSRQLRLAMEGHRFGFGYPVNTWGLYAALVLVGISVYGPRWVSRGSLGRRCFVGTMWFLALALWAQSLLLAQSRNAMLAVAVALPCALALVVYLRRHQVDAPLLLKAVLVFGVGLFLIISLNHDVLSQRFAEGGALQALIRGSADDMPWSSVSVRVDLWRIAAAEIEARPLIGAGPAATALLLQQAEDPTLRELRHFHQGYLEVLVRFGVVGGLLFFAWAAALGAAVVSSYRAGVASAEEIAFLSGAGLIIAIWSLNDFNLLAMEGRFLWILLAGLAFSTALPSCEAAPASSRGFVDREPKSAE